MIEEISQERHRPGIDVLLPRIIDAVEAVYAVERRAMVWVLCLRRHDNLGGEGVLVLVPAEESRCCGVFVACLLQKEEAVLVSIDELVAEDAGEDEDGRDEGAGARILGNCQRSLVAFMGGEEEGLADQPFESCLCGGSRAESEGLDVPYVFAVPGCPSY